MASLIFKPLNSSYFMKRKLDHGLGWSGHPWAAEIPKLRQEMKTSDPETFSGLLLNYTSKSFVIRVLSLCLNWTDIAKSRKAKQRRDRFAAQKHFHRIEIMLMRQSVPKVKVSLSTQRLSESFFEGKNGST